ncbi:MAG: hypothetical protein PHI40_02515 [Caldisericia bacterium]|nr:hypothetical protein [Caldisericia bacterium]
MMKRFYEEKGKAWKNSGITLSMVSVFMAILLAFIQGCGNVSKEPLQLNMNLKKHGFSVPYIAIEGNHLCIRDADLHETIVLKSLPTKVAISSKPIYRKNAMYFSIWDEDENSSWSSIWKYQIDKGDMILLWESSKEDCKLLNIDPTDTIFCLKKLDAENPALYFYNKTSSIMTTAVMDQKRSLDLCFFGHDASTVILGQSIEEVPEHYFFFVWTLDSSDRMYEIGRGVNPTMNESGTLFHYATVQPPSLVFYSLESHERISFRQQTNTIQWDFWTNDTFFLAEKFSPDDTQPHFYRLNMRGEKELLPFPIPLDEVEMWYIGMDQECPVIYIQSQAKTGFMKYQDTGIWQPYVPLAEVAFEKPVSFISEFVPEAQLYHSPYTLKCNPGPFLAFFVEIQSTLSSDNSQDLKTIECIFFNPTARTLINDNSDFQLVKYTMKGFHYSMLKSRFSLGAYEWGNSFNIQYNSKEQSNDNRPILISLTLGNTITYSEEMLHFDDLRYTSVLYSNNQAPRFHPLSLDPSGHTAFGWIDFIDSDGKPLYHEANHVLLPIQAEESLEMKDIFSLTKENIHFGSWVFPVIE